MFLASHLCLCLLLSMVSFRFSETPLVSDIIIALFATRFCCSFLDSMYRKGHDASLNTAEVAIELCDSKKEWNGNLLSQPPHVPFIDSQNEKYILLWLEIP